MRNHIRYYLHTLVDQAGDYRAKGRICDHTERAIMRTLEYLHTDLRYCKVQADRHRVEYYPSFPALVFRPAKGVRS